MSGDESPLYDSASQPEWYVMMGGERQGPFGLRALQQLISLGKIDPDCSVTRVGSTETMSLDLVDELRPLLEDAPWRASQPESSGGSKHDALNFDAPTELTDASRFDELIAQDSERPSMRVMVDLDQALLEAASVAPPAPDPALVHSPPPVPMVANRSNGAPRKEPVKGLFLPLPDDLAPTDSAEGADSKAVPARSAVVRSESQSGTIPNIPTGSRSESSLLFSVVESAGRGAAPAQAQSTGEAKPSDSSGLLDISSMAAATGSAKVRPRKSKFDDILSMGSSGLGVPSGPTLQAPTLAIAPSQPAPMSPSMAPPGGFNKTVVYTAGIVTLIITVGIAATQIMLHRLDIEHSPQVIVTNPPPSDPTQTPLTPPTQTPPTQTPPTQTPPTQTPPTPPFPTPPTARPEAPTVTPARLTPPNHPPGRPGGPVRLRPPAPLGPRIPIASQTNQQPPPNPTHLVPPPTPLVPAVDPNLPAQPSRDTVASAMGDVSVVVTACGIQSPTQVTINFAASGRVTTASVGAPYAGTEIGSCVARAVRGARLPPFRVAPLTVTYSFRP